MRTIYKYQIKITDRQTVQMPEGANILTAQMQHGVCCLWAEVDTANPLQKRDIEIHGTGNPMEQGINLQYISTVQQDGGRFIWHIFEAI